MIVAYIREGTSNNSHIFIRKLISTEFSFVLEPRPNPPDVVMQCTKNITGNKVFIDDVVECFSLRNNLEMLTSVQKPTNAVPIVDGLK